MHDCVSTRETAAELLRTAEDRSLPADVAGCPDCEAWWSEAAAALKILGRALDAAEPQDGYWKGYDSDSSRASQIQSRKRVVRRLGWGVAAAVAASVVMAVISVQERPAAHLLQASTSVRPGPTAPNRLRRSTTDEPDHHHARPRWQGGNRPFR